jgi:hypothetical protein
MIGKWVFSILYLCDPIDLFLQPVHAFFTIFLPCAPVHTVFPRSTVDRGKYGAEAILALIFGRDLVEMKI